MKISIIDIGTSSLKHYIFEQGERGRKLLYYKRNSEANLGESDTLSAETIARNIAILKGCLDLNAVEGAEKLRIVGTEILRKASNAREFTDAVLRTSGCATEIISQDKEALYLYEGFLDIVPSGEKFGAVNIGGGSSELVIGTTDRLAASFKFPFGAKFILKTFGDHDDIDWNALDDYLEKELQVPEKVPELFVTGVLDFMTQARPHIPFVSSASPYPEHPFILSVDDWRNWILALRRTPLAKLKGYFMKDPKFTDGVTIGQSVYYALAKKMSVERVIPSARDLTDGIVYEMGRG